MTASGSSDNIPRRRPCAVLAFLILSLLGTSACTSRRSSLPQNELIIPFRQDAILTVIRSDEAYLTLSVEIADDDSSRTRGLMQRGPLPSNSGMLFIFPQDEFRGFWMANTPIALDIAFANADSEIVHIAKYTKPLSPEQVFSEHPARFVLELPAGFSDAVGIIETDRLSWRRIEDRATPTAE